jgi:hypothetical protein
MPHPLDGCRLKVARAAELQQALLGEVASFFARRPYALVGEFEAPSAYVFRARVFEEPPRRFGVLIGDVLHNARSALDQLVWQLVILADNEPTRANGFTIYDDRAAYRRAERRLLRGVDAPHAAEIEGLQPFNSPYRGGDELALLRDLNNSDKHRVLATTIGWAERLQPVFHVVRDAEARLGQYTLHRDRLLRDGEEIARVDVFPTGPAPKLRIEVHGEVALLLEPQVALDVLLYLESAIAKVGSIIDSFTSDFPA